MDDKKETEFQKGLGLLILWLFLFQTNLLELWKVLRDKLLNDLLGFRKN